MPTSSLIRWRAARRIAAALANVRPAVLLTLPHAAWLDVGRRLSHYQHAVAAHWPRAAAHLREQLRTRLRWLATDLQAVLDDLHATGTEAPPSVPFLVAELAALEDEFPSVTLDLAASTLTVQTEPIILEGRTLGPFALVGHWERLPQEDFLEVRASEPRHPDDRDDVTHPHVLDDRLCEGAAAGALRQALAAGRLGDYFEIARRTLATYNPRSAYVTLSEWESRSCTRCGDRVAAGLLSDCPHCEESCCSDCDSRCDECDDSCCSGCLAVCRSCGTRACPDCTVDGPVHCPTCAMPPDDEEPLDVETEETAAVVTAPPHAGGLRDLAAADAALTPPAWAKLCWLRDRGETEIGGFGISPADDLLRIEDVVLVTQRTTAVSVAFEDAAVADYFEDQVAAGRQPAEFARIWIHTHPGDCPLPSATDERTFARVFGRCDWAVMLIVARGGATYARLGWHVGPGGSLRVPVRVEFTPPFGGSDVVAWAAEYDRCVQPEPLFAEPTDEMFADPFADDFADWPGTAQSARRHRPITRRQTRSLIPPALPHMMEPTFDDHDHPDDDHCPSTE